MAADDAPKEPGQQAPQVLKGTAQWLQTPAAQDWSHWLWPGKKNQPFLPTLHQGQQSVKVAVDRSMSVLRQSFATSSPALNGGVLRFSWMADRLFPEADLGVAGLDDSPVRVVLAFDGDRSRLSAKARMQSDLSRSLLGEEMPYATLSYVWCNTRPVGTVLVNPRTDRVRKIVVESGGAHLRQWRQYERDVRADYIQAFGEPPGRLIAIALMSDGDNTGGRGTAWFGPLSLKAGPALMPAK